MSIQSTNNSTNYLVPERPARPPIQPATDAEVCEWLRFMLTDDGEPIPICVVDGDRMARLGMRFAADAARIRALEDALRSAHAIVMGMNCLADCAGPGDGTDCQRACRLVDLLAAALAPAPPPAGKVG